MIVLVCKGSVYKTGIRAKIKKFCFLHFVRLHNRVARTVKSLQSVATGCKIRAQFLREAGNFFFACIMAQVPHPASHAMGTRLFTCR